MGKFFANQKLDEAGLVGVTLQKLLIFFMIVDAIWLFCGGSFFGAFMGILFHFFVFMGVYRRRTAVLLFYVIFHVVSFILVGVAIIFVVSALMYVQPDVRPVPMPVPDSYNYTGNETVTHSYGYIGEQGGFMGFVSRFAPSNYTRPNNKTRPHPPPPHKPNQPPHGGPNPPRPPHGSEFDSSYDYDDQNVFIISIAALLVSVIFLYCKILSVVLAHRMRKLLLASNNKATDTEAQKQPEPVEPVYVPAADFENAHPLFSQPNLMPYQPMVQAPQNLYPGQASAMMPPPFMYGQPVFYTFAPMPENENEDNNNNNNNQKL